jgi:predicted unusual protein kinase regulating ubiquinone biosynthesis (AarF/ABC1/UbiB family)
VLVVRDPERPGGRGERGRRLGGVGARHLSRQAVSRVSEPFRSERQREAARDEQILALASDLVTTLGSMKGAAMKLGQVISVLNFGLSSAAARTEFSQRLAPLFNQAPAVADAEMFRILDAELGARRSLIATIETPPVAAASLGQVYRAILTDGRRVAIKVQYPSARASVRADLKNLGLIVKLYSRANRLANLGLDDVVAEVAEQISAELDYEKELTNHDQVWRAHRDHPVFVIPEPITDLCTARVLVTDYLEGQDLSRLTADDHVDRDRLGEAIYRFYCGSIYTTGHFCADPHPGNIVLLPDARVGFVDFGLFVRMRPAEINVEKGVLAAVMTGDAVGAHRLAQEAGFIVDTESMPAQLTMDYIHAVAGWYLTPGTVRITDKVAYRCLSQAMLPGSHFGTGIFRQQMQRAHAFSRRTEMSVCALLGTLGAEGRWRDIAAEWILGAEPATEMGRQISSWQSRFN